MIGSTQAADDDLAANYGDNKASMMPTTTTFRLYIGDPTTTGVEVSAGGYAGVAVANTTANMGTPSGRQLGPLTIEFPSATADWGTPDHWANTDGSGNIRDTGAISSPEAIGAGQIAELTVTLSA